MHTQENLKSYSLLKNKRQFIMLVHTTVGKQQAQRAQLLHWTCVTETSSPMKKNCVETVLQHTTCTAVKQLMSHTCF